MQFDPPLTEARLIRRYKRFLADMEIAGEAVTAHCPNPGSMMGLAQPGSRCWLTRRSGTKLPYGWELVEAAAPASPTSSGGALVGIHTGRANGIVAEGLGSAAFPGLPTAVIAREVRAGLASRLDFRLLDSSGHPCWVEVKSVTLSRQPGLAEFPDSRTERGARHLAELGALVAAGDRAVLLFLVQRGDCGTLRLAADIDPAYAAALSLARAQGVEIRAFSCQISTSGIDPGAEIPFIHT